MNTERNVLDRLFEGSMPEPNCGCWLWIGALTGSGYPNLIVDGKWPGGHRASYEEKNGPLPPGMQALHHCDVKICVNPDHLFAGTQLDNMQDMDRKGRRPVKLSPEDIIVIKSAQKKHGVNVALAKQFGVTASHICQIRLNKAHPVRR